MQGRWHRYFKAYLNNINEYRDIDFDFVITVCDNARERCLLSIECNEVPLQLPGSCKSYRNSGRGYATIQGGAEHDKKEYCEAVCFGSVLDYVITAGSLFLLPAANIC